MEPCPSLRELLPPRDAPMGIVICVHALSVSFDDDLPLPTGPTELTPGAVDDYQDHIATRLPAKGVQSFL